MLRRRLGSVRTLTRWLAGAWLLFPAPAEAWGDDGHRVIGELAWRHLSPTARAAVQESLTDPGYETLAEASTWADRFARKHAEYDPMKPFHYVNVEASAPSYRRERDCPHGCVVTALTQFVALLETDEPPLTVSERRRCIYWISHFMGDIHQPLHVAHPDGKGGNLTLLTFFELPDKRNAHWIWDNGLLDRRPPPGAEVAARIATDQPAFRALADELFAGITPAQAAAYGRVTSAEALANEGLLLARRFAYLKTTDHVDAEYQRRTWPVVVKQLQKAGVRLAAVLNRALSARAHPATP